MDCFEKDTDYFAKGVKKIDDVKTARDCQSECQKEAKCEFWLWYEDKKCRLRKNKRNKRDKVKAGYITGPRVCPGKYYNYV